MREADLVGVDDVSGTLVIGQNRAGSIEIFDVSDPAHPRLAVSLRGQRVRRNAAFGGNYVLSAEGGSAFGFTVHDISAEGGLRFRHSDYGQRPLLAYQQIYQPPYLYVGGARFGPTGALEIRDVSGPVPVTLGSVEGPTPVFGVQVAGPIAYLGEQARLSVADVSVPSAPSLITSLPIRTSCLALNGKVLYAGTGDGNKLVVLDLANPKAPVILQNLPLPDSPVNMYVQSGILYVADYDGGLLLYDVSVPASPTLLSVYTGYLPVNDVAIDAPTAVIAVGASGVAALDVSNPAAPKLLSTAPMSGYALTVAMHGKIAYVGTAVDGCSVYGFDYADPKHLRTVHVSNHGEIISYASGSVIVSSFGFWGAEMAVACLFDSGSTTWMEFDNSQPRDVLDASQSGLWYRSTESRPAVGGGGNPKEDALKLLQVKGAPKQPALVNP